MKGAAIVIAGVLLAPVAARGDASVVSKGCKTFVTTKIEISGEAGASKCDAPKVRGGATKALAKAIRTGIEGCSPAKVGGYSLGGCCKVIERSVVRVRKHGKKPRPGYNQIEITTDPDYVSCVDGRSTGIWSTAESGEVFAHETGHLLGLDDQYVERTDADGNRVTPPVPGHEMDKMGAPGGKLGAGAAARAMLDALLVSKGARCPDHCCARTTTTTLPPGTWTGSLRYVYTDDDTYAYGDAIGSHTRNNHFRTEDLWTINGTTPAVPPERTVTVDTSWNGSLSFTKDEKDVRTDCVDGQMYLLFSASGQGTGQQQFGISPLDQDPNQFTFSLIASGTPNRIPMTGSETIQGCNGGGPITSPVNSTWDDGVGTALSCLGPGASGILAPDPGQPGHYSGRNPCGHLETPALGGAHVTDYYVEWDLQRSK
jgi:hypothetical protein